MADVATQIEALEQKAMTLKRQKKYLEALKKYEEVILLKRDCYGDRSETVSITGSFFSIFSHASSSCIVDPLG